MLPSYNRSNPAIICIFTRAATITRILESTVLAIAHISWDVREWPWPCNGQIHFHLVKHIDTLGHQTSMETLPNFRGEAHRDQRILSFTVENAKISQTKFSWVANLTLSCFIEIDSAGPAHSGPFFVFTFGIILQETLSLLRQSNTTNMLAKFDIKITSYIHHQLSVSTAYLTVLIPDLLVPL